ncbi:MAG TPA: peptidylprolyl isomerase [Myxococcales bacterium]
MRELLHASDANSRRRAALTVGRIDDPAAIAALERLLADPEASETAAWALGRIDGGQAALTRCLEQECPGVRAAARWSTDVAALLRALHGSAANEAGIALGVLARTKAVFPGDAAAQVAASRGRTGAAYALSRLPKSAATGIRAALLQALSSDDGWTRALAARAWGRHGLPAAELPIHDRDWRVRVEAARALATAPGARIDFADGSPQVLSALLEAAPALGVLAPSTFAQPALRCAAAQARDRVHKQVMETARACGNDWRGRARAGALAAELGLQIEARRAFADQDGRVRAAAAGAAGAVFAEDLGRLLQDPDPYVVQDAAGALAKLPGAGGSKAAAVQAVQRLAGARAKPAGDPESDALTALVALTGPVANLLPTANAALAEALGVHHAPVQRPPELLRGARVLRIQTSRGELIVDLHTDIAPLTGAALAALAQRHFYDGLDFHRVVPDFVVQGGDPRGDGDGGPGWAIPDEHSPLPFLRGTMGIATNGPETGGSQFFFCHSPAPHLDGRYTVAGQLRPESLPVMDALLIGDRILSANAE